MKKRADGRYCKHVQIGYQPNGKRKYKTIYGQTKREVEEKERKLLGLIDDRIYIDQHITVGEWADVWLSTYKTNVEHNTVLRYKAIIDNQIKPTLGSRYLDDVTSAQLQVIINRLSQKYSSSTVHKFFVTLNQMYKAGMGQKLVHENPCMYVTLQREPSPEREVIPPEIVLVLNDFCLTHTDGALILTLLYTGMRRGEILALQGKDIDWERNCFNINKSVEFLSNQPRLKSPKTKSGYRSVPILSILKPYQAYFKSIELDEPIFKNKHGTTHTLTSIRRLFEKFNSDYNNYVKDKNPELCYTFTMHQFRHTYATMLYKSGVDVKAAQNFLGHSSISVTMDIYTHLDQQHKEISADKLDNFVLKTSSKMNGIQQQDLVKI